MSNNVLYVSFFLFMDKRKWYDSKRNENRRYICKDNKIKKEYY